MNVLIVGSGNGSMAMRGHQIGRALCARVVGAPSVDDLQWADVAILIKRAGRQWASLAQKVGTPIVWDALDFWDQPEQNTYTETEARALLREWITAIRPTLIIGATEAMADACGGVYLPHHPWIGLAPASARPVVTSVGYQGTKKFLGQWANAVQTECERRNWKFLINPPDMRACDLVVALRDGKHDGWMCQEWKSGVKLVNAMTAGRPVITQDSAAWREMRPVGCAVQTVGDLARAFDRWTSFEARAAAVHQPTAQYTLEAIVARYQSLLASVRKGQAA